MKFNYRAFLRGLQVVFVMAVVFCFWGMFDAINWAVLYGAESFPFPFFSFYLNVYASADILITVGCASAFGLAYISFLRGKGSRVKPQRDCDKEQGKINNE